MTEEADKKRRIAIAEDVLLQLENGRYVARQRAYLRSPEPLAGGPDADLKTTFDALFAKPEADCETCAIGAAYVSAVRLYDEEKHSSLSSFGRSEDGRFQFYGVETVDWPSTMHELLGRWFSHEQLYLIEVAFEGGADVLEECDMPPAFREELEEMRNCDNACADPSDLPEVAAAINFLHPDVSSLRESMRRIWKNVLDNGGEFKP